MDDLWGTTLYHLERGNFTALENALGGPDGFDKQLVTWHREQRFDTEPELLAEALTCACMLGRTETVRYLLDAGVDPLAGIKTGMNGFHYAASGGKTDVIRLMIERKASAEELNMYGGTVLGQALWSAVNEPSRGHADVVELLLNAGAEVEPGTLEWWGEQNVPDPETKRRISEVLAHCDPKQDG